MKVAFNNIFHAGSFFYENCHHLLVYSKYTLIRLYNKVLLVNI